MKPQNENPRTPAQIWSMRIQIVRAENPKLGILEATAQARERFPQDYAEFRRAARDRLTTGGR